MKATIWTMTKNEPFFLNLMIPYMLSHSWVENILIMHTDKKIPEYYGQFRDKRVREAYKNFGDFGFGKSIENGGFNEIACRNYIIEMAEKMNGEWLLQCDSDELYTQFTAKYLNMSVDILDFMCYNFHTPITGKHEQYHIRAWKKHIKLRYSQNPNQEFLSKYINKSNHCIIEIPKNSNIAKIANKPA